jgi:hypothetical protein
MRDQGMPAEQIIQRMHDASSRIDPLIEPALLYFHKKGIARAQWEDMILHLEEEAGLAEKSETPGQIRRAIMFVDLASFTPLAEAMGRRPRARHPRPLWRHHTQSRPALPRPHRQADR